MEFNKITVVGAGRWGGFLAWYCAKVKNCDTIIFGLESDPGFCELRRARCNDFLTMPENAGFSSDLGVALDADLIIVSVGAQNFRGFCESLHGFDLSGKTFLLAMKGLEEKTLSRMTEIFRTYFPRTPVAVLGGPGHVQDYLRGIPSASVIDSDDPATSSAVANFMATDLMRAYIGTDLIGTEIGAAMKNVIGLAAGILDGLDSCGLKGALMARAPREVGRIIAHFGGNPQSAYGLCHLGDYEATLFSQHSHNRAWGESFARGEKFTKLAEGVPTLRAIAPLFAELNLPICESLYRVIEQGADIKSEIENLMRRPVQTEF